MTTISDETRAQVHPGKQPARGRSARARARLFQFGFLAPAVIYIIAFFAYPAVKNVVMSFQEYTTATFFTGEAPWVGVANYVSVFTDGLFTLALTNTVIFTLASIAGQFVIGLLLALFFLRRFPLSNAMRGLLLLPWLIPLIASSSIWRWMLDVDNGIVNGLLLGLNVISEPIQWLTSPQIALVSVIIVNIWLGIPFNVAILYGGLRDLPGELYEAAALDGATGVRAFRWITWPLLRPVVTVVLVLGVIYTLKVFDVIIGLTGGGPANATQTLATQSYELSFRQFVFGEGAAMSNVLIIISLVFAALYMAANRRSVED